MSKFTKSQRLLSASDYQQVIKSPRKYKVVGEWLIVFSCPNQHEMARLGLAITKRKVRKAVMRNQIKRIVRESFRLQQDLPAMDAVVTAKVAITEQNKQQLRDDIDNCWRKLIKHYQQCSSV